MPSRALDGKAGPLEAAAKLLRGMESGLRLAHPLIDSTAGTGVVYLTV